MPHRAARREVESQVLTLDGGINYLDPSQVRPNEHVAGRNWFMDRDGVVRPRPGNTRWNVTALGGEMQGLWEYRRQADGINALIGYAVGQLSKGEDTLRTFAALKSSLSATARGYAFTAQDKFWWCNAEDIPQVYDGTNIFRIGIVNPVSAPAVVLVALAGNLPAETHFYRYTYVREESGVKVKESNPSPESTGVTNTAANAQNDVLVTASADSQVTHVYIYRRSTTSVPEHKFVAKVTNTTQTYRDNIAASSLGGFAFWGDSGGIEDHGYPPTELTSIVLHRDDRTYAWGKRSRLFYTRRFAFNYWPGANAVSAGLLLNAFQIIVNEDDGDEGVAIVSEGDDLWLLKHEHVYRLLGDGPDKDDGTFGSWRVEQVATKHGCGAAASAATGPAGTFWLSEEGIVVRVDERSGAPRPIGLKLLPWVRRSVDRSKAVGWVHDVWYFIFLPMAGGTWEGHAWNLLNGSWWPIRDADVRAMATREGGKLMWGGVLERDKPSNGIVYEWDGQTTDNGTAVTAELTTRIIDDAVGRWKWWPTIQLIHEARPGATLTTRLIPDQTASYVEQVRKLLGPAGARIVSVLRGTKRLQGQGVQLYLKSANMLNRPAIYGWRRLVHTFNRNASAAPFFADVVTDPRPDWFEVSADLWSVRVYDQLL